MSVIVIFILIVIACMVHKKYPLSPAEKEGGTMKKKLTSKSSLFRCIFIFFHMVSCYEKRPVSTQSIQIL